MTKVFTIVANEAIVQKQNRNIVQSNIAKCPT